MNVTKVKLKKDQALFDRVYQKDSIFYVGEIYRASRTTTDISDVFSVDTGEKLGSIRGYYFDFGSKDVFEGVKEDN